MRIKKEKNQIPVIAGGVLTVLVICLLIVFGGTYRTARLRYDPKKVEYVTEGETVTCVNIEGKFPYRSIVPKLAEQRTTDAEGNVTEIYEIEAELSLNRGNSMKLYIETSDAVTYTYILKFADKDVTISNGKVVE